jgi:hypothetical protein
MLKHDSDLQYIYVCKGKGKVVPLQARCDLEGSRRFRLPDFHDIRHMKVVRSSASRTGRLNPQECSWYSFSLGAESTPGPWCGRKEKYVCTYVYFFVYRITAFLIIFSEYIYFIVIKV